MTKTLELKLTDGTKIIRTFDLKCVYNLVGHTRRRWRLDRKFPFLHAEDEEYVTFRYQDQYDTMRDDYDTRISALISIAEFASAFDVDFVSYEELKLRTAVSVG